MTQHPDLIPPESPEWMATLDRVRHDTYHLPGYVQMEAGTLGGEAMAFRYRDGDRHLLLPMVLRSVPDTPWNDAVSPYGYPGLASNVPATDESFWRAACTHLVDLLESVSALTFFVRLNPIHEAPRHVLSEFGAVMHHGATVAIDLTLSPEEMWARTRSNHRYQIRRARRAGLRMVIDDWSRVETFAEIYYETMRRVGADNFYFFARDYFEELHAALGKHAHLALVESEDEVLGGGVFLESCGIVQYHLGASRTSGLVLQPTKLMFDEIRRWAKDRNNSVLHLGGGVGGEGNPLFHFKTGFSDWQLPFYTWRIITNDRAYIDVVGSRIAGPEGHDHGEQYFPAYRDATFPPNHAQ